LYPCFKLAITEGNIQVTLLILPSNQSSQKNNESSIKELFLRTQSLIITKMATAIGRSNLVQTFLISDGDKFKIILRGGKSIHTFLKTDLSLSFDSLIEA